MRLRTRHPVDARERPAGVGGTIRMGRRTASLLRRLRPGDIAVIDHPDLDRACAEELVSRGVVAVVNASAFISGRYPNLGPELLARSGVLMVDQVGPSAFSTLRDGARARVHDGTVLVGDSPVVSGRGLGGGDVTGLMDEARRGLATQLDSFTHNTTEFLRREQELVLEGRGIPETVTPVRGRPVVVVVRDHDYREDLRGLRAYIREQRPVLVGVDAGADALLEAGYRPDIVVAGGDGLSVASGAEAQGGTVSDKALREAREVVLHADSTGHAPDGVRLSRLGIKHRTLSASGRSEDVALLLADVRGASLLLTVGIHAPLDELLDRQRPGLPGTFLTRLRVGPRLVDAKAVPQLHAGRVRLWHLALILLTGLVALAVAVGTTPVGAHWWDQWSAQCWSVVTEGVSRVRTWLEALRP
jgi:uncharacterized membrane-anchored protein